MLSNGWDEDMLTEHMDTDSDRRVLVETLSSEMLLFVNFI